ncbi:MAG: amidase [Acidimicrobiaceae bacterium]|nr:amidase [Acidimicrobiaceae bacterium]MYG55571.1 amidase [Acidimicrobiaceae bacterium]MYJ98639.1 amidase [Acidimicrobiaceae bacterium]
MTETSDSSELARVDAVGLAELVRSGEISPRELIDDTIDRIERIDPQINAVIQPSFDKARAIADSELPDGPFRGVPMLLKDLWPCSVGDPFHLGVLGLKNARHTATFDANITTAYRRAGFVLCGRTNSPEMGLAATTEPLSYGATHNPWDLSRSPGGSSGGAAAAVAAGMLPAANASDGGGSIRIPAAMCGLVGLKPSRGRISQGPHNDEWSNSVQHVVCHTVRDSAAILDATAGPFPGDGVVAPAPPAPYAEMITQDPPPLRIGMLAASIRSKIPIDPEVAGAVHEAAVLLERLGHTVDEDSPATLHDEELIGSFGPGWAVGVARSLEQLGEWIGRDLTENDVEPMTWVLAQRGRQMPALDLARSTDAAMTFRRLMAQWWLDGHDLLLAPTCLRPPAKLGEMSANAKDPAEAVRTTLAYSTMTAPFNTTGQPAISLPLARSSGGLPIGIQLVAAYGKEHVLLQVARQLELEVNWADQRSPLHP